MINKNLLKWVSLFWRSLFYGCKKKHLISLLWGGTYVVYDGRVEKWARAPNTPSTRRRRQSSVDWREEQTRTRRGMWLIVWMSCAVLTDVSGSKEAVLWDVLQKVLHITPPVLTSASPRLAAPPRHMLELYQKYTNGRSGSIATTIRNILPQSPPGNNP